MYAKNHQIWLRRFKDKINKICAGLTFLDHVVCSKNTTCASSVYQRGNFRLTTRAMVFA